MRKVIFLAAFSVFIPVSAMIVVLAVQPKIPVGSLLRILAATVGRNTGSTINIRGEYHLIPGKWLQVFSKQGEIEIIAPTGSRIHLTIGNIETKVHVPGLLKNEVRFDGISIRGLDIDIAQGNQSNDSISDRGKSSEAGGFSKGFRLRRTGMIAATDIAMKIGSGDTAAPAELQITSLNGTLKEKSTGEIRVAGILASQSFEGSLKTEPLGSSDPDVPLEFQARFFYKESVAGIDGLLAYDKEGFNLSSTFSLKGNQFADIAALFGYQPQKYAPFSLGGSLMFSPGEKKLEIDRISPGTANARVSATLVKTDKEKPSVSIRAEGDLMDADTLLSVFGPGQQPESPFSAMRKKNAEDGHGLFFNDFFTTEKLDIDVEIGKLIIAGRKIDDLVFHTVMNNGVISDAPFAATFAETAIDGHYSLDAQSEPPQFSARLTSGPCDVGRILADATLAEGFELTLNKINSSLKTTGARIDDLIGNLEFGIEADGGSLRLKDPNTKKNFPLEITHSTINGMIGGEIAFELHGNAHEDPLHIAAVLDTSEGPSRDRNSGIPFRMKVDHNDNVLELDGKLPVPFSLTGTSVNVELAGKDIGSLDNLLGIEIPVTGDYRLTGSFRVVPEGYQLSIGNALLGGSLFEGALDINTRSRPPELSLHLKAEKIQLAGLNRTPVSPDTPPRAAPSPTSENAPKPAKFTDQAIIDSFNAMVSVEAEAVFSGDDYLGNGSLHILQKDGALSVSPVHISLPDGTVDMGFTIEPVENDRLYGIDIDIRELDYGAVSRWFKPETDQEGTLSLRTSIKARVKPDEDIMSQASGYIDFVVQPVNLTSGVIDLWAVNLVSYVMPLFTPTKESKLHCISGRFTIKNGKMQHEELLVDTSRIQVRGTMEVDFAEQWIESRLRPIPKRPQFYSLAAPVIIRGRLDDLKVGLARGSVIGTIIRIATSYIVVPVQWIIFDKVPRDGSEQCLQVFNGRTDQSGRGEDK